MKQLITTSDDLHNRSIPEARQLADKLAILWRLCTETAVGSSAKVGSTVFDSEVALRLLDVDSKGQFRRVTPYEDELYRTKLIAHHRLRWRSSGFPSFRVTHGLAASLILTDCSGIRGRDIKMPFDAFMIDMPTPRCPISITNVEGNQSPVKFISVHRYQTTDNVNILGSIYKQALGLERNDLHSMNGTISDLLKLADVAIWNLPWWLGVYMLSDDGTELRYNWALPAEDDNLHSMFGNTDTVAEITSADASYGLSVSDQDSYAIAASVRVAINLVLFINSLPVEKKVWERRSSKTVNDQNGHEPSTWVVGREIKIPREMADAAASFSKSGEARNEWKIKSRFVVRGHWRDQPCGPSMSDRKRIWIRPFWKGPVDGPGLVRKYEVGLPGGSSE